jgi:hypothetical protein
VIQLVSKDQSPQRWEDLPPAIQDHIRNQVLDGKREVRLQAMTDSLRRTIPVTIRRDRLARVPWPVPPAGV